jgi:hypothetical protein
MLASFSAPSRGFGEACPYEPRLLGALPAAPIPLDPTRGDPTRPWPLHSVPVDQSRLIGTSVALSQFGLENGYAQVLANLWAFAPLLVALQAVLLLIVWIHGCLGVHFWLRLKPFYPRVKGLLLSIAVLLPALALLGYYQGGQRALVAVQDSAWLARNFSPEHDGSPAQNAVLLDERTRTLAFLAVALAATLSARASDKDVDLLTLRGVGA